MKHDIKLVSTSNKICRFCDQLITRATGGVDPGFGFGWHHPKCWSIHLVELNEDGMYLERKWEAEGRCDDEDE